MNTFSCNEIAFTKKQFNFIQHLCKIFSSFNYLIAETPSELIQMVPPEMKEGIMYTVACSIPYHCFAEPIKLSIQRSEDHNALSQKSTTETQRVKAELTFKATWEDHGKQLTCLLETHEGRKTKLFANLMVKCEYIMG